MKFPLCTNSLQTVIGISIFPWELFFNLMENFHKLQDFKFFKYFFFQISWIPYKFLDYTSKYTPCFLWNVFINTTWKEKNMSSIHILYNLADILLWLTIKLLTMINFGLVLKSISFMKGIGQRVKVSKSPLLWIEHKHIAGPSYCNSKIIMEIYW